MRLFFRNQIIFLGMTGLFALVSLNTEAMMGGRGSSDVRGNPSDTHMGFHTGGGGHGTGFLGNGGGYGGDHIQYPHDPKITYVPGRIVNLSSGKINRGTVEQVIHRYMRKHHSGLYKLGDMRDGGSFFIAEIIKTDGSLIQWILIDKRSGDIRSMR